MRLSLVLLAVLLIVCPSASSVQAEDCGPNIDWSRTYDVDNVDAAYDVKRLSDGGLIHAGGSSSASSRAFLIRTNPDGDVLWTRTYGGSGWDLFSAVEQTEDRGFIAVGSTGSYGGSDADVWIIRTDGDGDTLWTKVYGGNNSDNGGSVKQTADGGFMIVGSTRSFGVGGFYPDGWIIRTDANGDSLWSRTYGGSASDGVSDLTLTDDGGVLAVGTTSSFGAGNSDLWLIRTDANGDSLWTRIYGDTYRDSGAAIESTDDGFIVCGSTSDWWQGGNDDLWLIRTDTDGDSLWSRVYGGSDNDWSEDVVQTQDGGFALLGTSYSYGPGFQDFWLIRTDANGDSLWTQTYGSDGTDNASAILTDPDGGLVMVGSTQGDAWLIKTVGCECGIDLSIIDHPTFVLRGTTATFLVELSNPCETVERFDLVDVEYSGPVTRKMDLLRGAQRVPPESSFRQSHSQPVPVSAPLGLYQTTVRAWLNGELLASDQFLVEVID